MDKPELITLLRNLADTLEKDSVKLDHAEVEASQFTESGVTRNGTYNTHAPNGEKTFDLYISFYDKESDKSYEAHTQ